MFRLIMITSLCLGLMGCGGGNDEPLEKFNVTAAPAQGGHLQVTDPVVFKRDSTLALVVPDPHYKIVSVKGCSGKLEAPRYVTGTILADCELTAVFALETFSVSVAIVSGGSATPATQEIPYNSFAKVSISADEGYRIKSVSGCDGVLTGKNYTTAQITSACTIVPVFEVEPPIVASSPVVINGLAAEGAPLRNTNIAATCADGSGFLDNVVSDAQGNFSGQVTTAALPCALVVTNPDSGVQYFSLATQAGRVNITSLTSLVIAFASQQAGSDWLLNGDWQSTASQLPLAQTLLGKALIKAGYNLPEGVFLPLTTEFKVGDDWDKVLDQLQAAIQSNSIGSFDALVNLIKDGNLSSLPAPK